MTAFQKLRLSLGIGLFTMILGAGLSFSALAQTNTPAPGADEVIVLPGAVPDPFEPINRAMWSFNKGLMIGVFKPTGKVYRVIIPQPMRRGVGNFGRNLTYPGRVLNHLFQGRWSGAGDETRRFFFNTVIGGGGFFDVATKMNIPKSDAEFGQTLAHCGWRPHVYLMLPLFGPSNERDTVGLSLDTATNPLMYISPYEFVASDPLTYLGPYTYFTYVLMFNNLSDSVDEYARFSRAEMDPYAQIHYAWTFARKFREPDFQMKGEQDAPSLETLGSALFKYKDPKFLNLGKTRSVRISSTGGDLKFTVWLQKTNAPVVYFVPGLGSHRLALSALGLAELAYKNGFSVVCVSSAYNAEFMEEASTAAVPGYLPADGHDLHVALTAIDGRLRGLYPGKLGARALMGASMGALHTLYVASTARTNESLIKFDRYVALHTPVRTVHGLAKLDEFYRAPLEWPTLERTANMENTFLKMALMEKKPLEPEAPMPFSAVESKFLIGLTFRLILRDIIYNSQRRHSLNVLHSRLDNFRRGKAYDEILKYSYRDYFEKFVTPYYESRGLKAPVPVAETLARAGDLRAYEAGLQANLDVRVIVNRNDFLLGPEDVAWLEATFGLERLKVFDHGGHLGNFSDPAVQKSILQALDGLGPAATTAAR